MALTSASQTSMPSTLASPLYHHMLRRLFSLRHVILDPIAGLDRLAELHLVDRHEEDLLGLRLLGDLRRDADRAGRLRHALDQIDAGKDRPRGKWPVNCGSLIGDVLDADAGPVAVDLDDLVDQQKRIAMRQQLQDLHDVGGLKRARRLAHEIGLRIVQSVFSAVRRHVVSVGGIAEIGFGRKLFQRVDLAEPLPHGPGRDAAPAGAGRNIAVDAAGRGDLGAHADRGHGP